MDIVSFSVAAFTAIFSIVNPLGAIPLLVTITEGYTEEERMHVITKAVFSAFLVLVVFALFGNLIFAFFGITVSSFRIAGGILLMSVGFSMTRGQPPRTKSTPEEREEAAEKEEVGIVPMGVPMLAGPGSISTVMIFISKSEGPLYVSAVLFSILLTLTIAFVMFIYAEKIFRRIGRVGARAFSRIMGLILMAIAVEFIIEGIHSVLLEWGAL